MSKERQAVRQSKMPKGGAYRQYREFFVGRGGFLAYLRYDLAMFCGGPMPGALGHLLRKWLYSGMCASARKVAWGRNVSIRHPFKMEIGRGSNIDDNCFLDARGAEPGGFSIGDLTIPGADSVCRSKCPRVSTWRTWPIPCRWDAGKKARHSTCWQEAEQA